MSDYMTQGDAIYEWLKDERFGKTDNSAQTYETVQDWLDDDANIHTILDVSLGVYGDGHTIFNEDFFLKLGLPGWIVDQYSRTYESETSSHKSTIYGPDGKVLEELKGVYGLPLVEAFASRLGGRPNSLSGRGFRAAAACEEIERMLLKRILRGADGYADLSTALIEMYGDWEIQGILNAIEAWQPGDGDYEVLHNLGYAGNVLLRGFDNPAMNDEGRPIWRAFDPAKALRKMVAALDDQHSKSDLREMQPEELLAHARVFAFGLAS